MLSNILNKFRDNDVLPKMFKNAGVLLTGNVGAALIGFATFALTARTIGSESLGILVLVTTYVAVIDKLINFQSWQALIKYGSDALKNDSEEDFKSILKFGYFLDALTALAAAIISATSVWLLGKWINFSQDTITMTCAYSVVAISHISGGPIAVLRIFDKFNLFAIITLATALFKLLCIIIVSSFKPELWIIVIVYGLTDVFGNILLIFMSLYELKKQGYRDFNSSSLSSIGSRFPGIWSFVFVTNLNGSIRMASKEADVLLVGALLSPSLVGLYKVAKQLSSVLSLVVDPLYHAIYPLLTKLNAAGDDRGMIKISLGGSFFAFIVGGIMLGTLATLSGSILLHIFGTEFMDSQYVLLWYSFAVFLAIVSFPLSPLIVSKGHPKILLFTLTFSTAIYFSALPLLISIYGLSGAGMAYVIFYITWIVLSCIFIFFLFGVKLTKEKS